MCTSISKHLEVKNDRLYFDGVDLLQVAEDYKTPVFIFSESKIRENARLISDVFKQEYGDCYIHYALKANSILSILRILKGEQLRCEVSSGGELYKALKAGFKPEDIVYNGPGKTLEELKYAVEVGIDCINVDSLYELNLLANLAEKLKTRIGVSIRISPEVSAPSIKTGLSKTKFGVEINQVVKMIRHALEKRHLHLKGVHMHIGSQVTDIASWSQASMVAVRLANQIYEDLGLELDHINMGGGLPEDYTETIIEKDKDVPSYLWGSISISEIARAVSKNFKDLKYNTKLYIEPGRKLVADTCLLLTKIVNFKERSFGEKWLIVDAGFNILPSMRILRWYYPVINISRINERYDSPFRIGGPLCDGEDVYHDVEGEELGNPRLPKYRLLPTNSQPGDVLAVLHTGAYGPEVTMNFNGMLRPAYLMILQNAVVKVIRRRETLNDLVSYEEV